jgi:hypothetical protein
MDCGRPSIYVNNLQVLLLKWINLMRIEDMTLDQLYEMNAIICERIDYLRAKKEQDAIQQLHLGSEVSFKTQSGETLFGIVIKINKKTVGVVVDGKY